MERQKYERLVESLQKNADKLYINGLEIEVRNCEGREAGRPDPANEAAGRVTREDFASYRERLAPQLWANEVHLLGPQGATGLSRLEYLRAQFGWTSSDVSTGIRTICHRMTVAGEPFRLYQYEVLSAETDRPCLLYIHGGGFFGGDIATLENQCKLLAQLSGGVVCSVDYPLCPEHPYPAGADACYEALQWIHAHASELGISREKVGIAGDSAGGNLALACALRDREQGGGRIAYQALLYPVVDMRERIDSSPYWDRQMYDNPYDDPLIEAQICMVGEQLADIAAWYVPAGTDVCQPCLSPILAELDGLPRTLMITVEYDFLRGSCEAFSRKLQAAGVETRHIRYGGCGHGVFDRLGYAPQADDMVREIAADLLRL